MKKTMTATKAKGAEAETARPGPFAVVVGTVFAVSLALAPFKFGNPVAVPEMPNFPGPDGLQWLFFNWPPILFPLLTGAWLLFLAFFLPSPRRSGQGTLIAGLWTALALVSLLGIIDASTADFWQTQCAHFFSLAAFALAVFRCAEALPSTRTWLSAAIVATMAMIAVEALDQYYNGFAQTREYVLKQEAEMGMKYGALFHNRLNDNRVYAPFALPNSLAAHLILTAPLCLWGVFSLSRSVSRKFPFVTPVSGATMAVFLAGLFAYVLYLTGSRSAIAAMSIGYVAAFFILPFRTKTRIRVCVLAAVIGSAAFACAYRYTNPNPKSIHIRIDYFDAALDMLKRNPLVGTGWGDFFHEYCRVKKYVSDEAPHCPHNFLLSLGSQAGALAFLVGLAVLAVPVFFIAMNVRGRGDGKTWTGLEFAAVCGWTAWALHSLTDLNAQIPGTVMTAITLAALAIAPRSDAEETGATSPTGLAAVSARLAGLFPPRIWRPIALPVAAVAILFALNRIPGEIAFQTLYDLTDPRGKSPEDFQKITMAEVRADLERCARLMPRSPYPWACAATFAMSKGELKEAERDFGEASLRSPERSSFFYRRFIALLALKRFDEAETCLARAKDLFPFEYGDTYERFRRDRAALEKSVLPSAETLYGPRSPHDP